jgi:hypothetical protein
MNQEQKLDIWAEREIKRNLHTMIVADEEGGYVVFGRYYIVPGHQLYTVFSNDDKIGTFSSKRTALSWCVADKSQNITLARTILNLDQKKQQVSADIDCRSRMAQAGRTPEFQETVRTKLEPKIIMYKSISSELEKCVISAKYIQLRGFSNETARTGTA